MPRLQACRADAVNLGDLRAATRAVLNDIVEPYLWQDDFIDHALNNAVREACIRARLLKDDEMTQPKLCQYTVQPNQPLIAFDPTILVPRSGRMASGYHKLWALTAESMDRVRPCWENSMETPGCPRFMIMDLSQKTIRLHPTPEIADTLNLRVWRMPQPTELMQADADTPVIQIPDAEELKHWAAYEAYLSPDGESAHTERAQLHLAYFEQRFGARPSLHEMARWADSPPRVRHAVMY